MSASGSTGKLIVHKGIGLQKYRKRGKKTITKRQVMKMLKTQGDIQIFTRYDPAAVGGNAVAFNSISSAPVETDLFGLIRQGDGEENRNGNEIRVKDVLIKYVATVADSTQIMRLVLYLAEESTGASTPMVTAGFTYQQTLSSKVAYGTNIKRVLADKFICLSAYNVNQFGQIKIHFKNPLLVKYATDANNANNTKLYCLAVSDSGAVAHPSFSVFQYSIYFTS